MTTRTCAYCGVPGPLTRDHVVPDFLYRSYPDQKLGYNEKARRFLEFEAIVRDVCAHCNSGVLSSLDAYGERFVRDNRCGRTFTKRPTVLIHYDHELLLRWLLKLSYNAVRFAGREPGLLGFCTGFIRGVASLPYNVALFIEIVRDAILPEEVQYSTPDASGVTRRLSARRFRFGETSSDGDLPAGQCRLVGLNAFYLYVVLLPQAANSTAGRGLIGALRQVAPQAVQLAPRRRAVRVRVSKRTIIEAYWHQAVKDLPAWSEYLASGGA